MKKFKKVLNIFSWILSFFMLFTVIAAVALTFFGYRFLCVSTGSMEPEYPVGSVVLVVPTQAQTLSKGDVITFRSGEWFVTHRVVSVDRENHTIKTKGDNNNVEDFSPVEYSSVVGRVKFRIKYIGYAALFFATLYGKIAFGGVIVFFIIIRVIINHYSDER